MKKIFSISLLALLAVVFAAIPMRAQQNPMMEPLPVDSGVRVGKLPNGLTYYIRHNEFPKGQADFYIAQNVGSALENDEQRGLAHFLEHMCFNGTTNFPGNLLRDWLESVGVKFGYNLNAYTGVDKTVYLIKNVPTSRESVQDSCLLILHDWANDLTLAPEEIDKERGVIHEEWRRSNVGQMRILEKILPDLFPTTKYGHRLPIGTMEVVDNFPHQALRDYYEAWYRPDQQAVIVVGDIDVDRIENKIKEMFSSIEMPADAPARVYEPVPDHKGTLYGIGSDPEQQTLISQIFFLSDPMPAELKNTPAYLLQDYVEAMITSMLDSRLSEIASKPDSPFAGAGVSFTDYIVAKEKDAFAGFVAAKGTDIIDPLKSVYREILRAQRGGFTHSEYDRARSEFLSNLEKQYNNRTTRENDTYVQEYVDNFTEQEPMPGIAKLYEFYSMIAPMLPVDMINQAMAQVVTPDNRALVVMSPEGEGYTLPTTAALDAALSEVDAEEIAPFVDEVKSEPLIPVAPVPGKIVSSVDNKQWGALEWTLSNGVKVFVKQTKFKDDEILLTARANGGFAGYPVEMANTIISLPLTLRANGLGSYSNNDLEKYLAGKQASVNLEINGYSREISGSTTPKDLPTMMELLYMTFKDLQFTEAEFEALQKAYSGVLANQEKSPEYQFGKMLTNDLYASPFRQSISAEAVKGASREQTISLAHDMTANAADFTFVFVGNVDPEVLRPLVETYIASLPADAAKSVTYKEFDPAMFTKTGSGVDNFAIAMTNPQTYVAIFEKADMEYNPKNALIASIAGQILTNRLLATVREDMGAVYSIGASGYASRQGLQPFQLATQFPMKPEMKQEVLDFIYGQFKAMESDIKAEELNPAKEYMTKTFTEQKEKNSPWLNGMVGWITNGVDTFNGNVDVLNSITVEDVQNYMKALNAADNLRTVILDPETTK
ncbi:MAG: insulinase family protein [Muribaculaceae bacterium]|nr:insulinase family protein [Muribaculaceae bacterium]